MPLFLDYESGQTTSLFQGSIKDIQKIDTSEYIISTNKGAFLYKTNTKNWKQQNIPSVQIRSSCAYYDKANDLIFAGTTQGLKIGNKQEASYFQLNDKPLICSDMESFKDLVFVSTQNEGLILFKNGKYQEKWDIETGLISNFIKKIQINKNKIYLATG